MQELLVMLIPKYTITNSILKNIGVIEAAKEVTLSLSIIPAWENKLKRQALERFIYYGVRMEGSKVLEEEVTEIIDGRETDAAKIDIVEVENNRNLYKFITELSRDPSFITANINLDLIAYIHQLATQGILEAERIGKPRSSQIVLRDTITGDVSYSPPPAAEVEYLLDDLLNFLATDGKEYHPVVKAAIVHFEIYRIHPFIEGNIPVARALSLLILKKEGYSINDLLVMEDYFDNNLEDYYSLLQKTSSQKVLDSFERDLSLWIDYFSFGVAAELTRLKDFARKISAQSKAQDQLGESLTLNERQMIIMEYLERHKSMMNKDFRKIFPDFSDDTVLRELKFLKNKGLIKKVGNTKKATYVLAKE